MREHAVLVPTCVGPVGGVVSEPPAERKGALIFLPGAGPSGRAGVNAHWARLSRDIAALGLLVLRIDLVREGESTLAGYDAQLRDEGWRRSTDLAILRDVAPWFLEQAGEHELLLAASCYGGRVALEFAASDPSARGLFTVIPYLWSREPAQHDAPPAVAGPQPPPVWANGPTLHSDAEVLDGFRAALSRGPVWLLAGEGEEAEGALRFARQLERTGATFELEVVPSMTLHPIGNPVQQEVVRQRMLARIVRALLKTALTD
jgi:dienelactone hydrolase